MAEPKTPNLDKVYAEASQWVRMANTIVWSAGNFLIPASLAPFGALLTQASSSFNWKHHLLLAVVSIGIAFVWLFITVVYYKTTKAARETLVAIEEIWFKSEKDKAGETKLLFNSRQALALGVNFEEEVSLTKNPIIKLQSRYILGLFVVWIVVWFLFSIER